MTSVQNPPIRTDAQAALIVGYRDRAWMGRPLQRRDISRPATHLALLIICAVFILPFLWMVSTSLKRNDQAMAYPPRFIPKPVMIENYRSVWRHPYFDMALFTRNTLLI